MPTRASETVALELYRPRHVRVAMGYATNAEAERHWREPDWPGVDDDALGGKVVTPAVFRRWLRDRVERVRKAELSPKASPVPAEVMAEEGDSPTRRDAGRASQAAGLIRTASALRKRA